MKLSIIISILFFFSVQQDNQLKGKYRMEYEENYKSQNCIIEFKDNTYKRRFPDGKIVEGKIVYQNFIVELKDKKSRLQMDLLKRNIQKDTIFFGTTDIRDKRSDDDLVIYSGKMIKIK